MNLFLINWGKNYNGAKYAIVGANSKADLFWQIDQIGDPSDVKAVEVNNDSELFYVELSCPDKAYVNNFNQKIDFDDYGELNSEEDLPDIFNGKEWFDVT